MPFQTQLTWLTDLAGRHQAGKSYAWTRALELDKEPSGLFAGMSDALTLAMGGQVKSLVSAPLTPVKPRSVGRK